MRELPKNRPRGEWRPLLALALPVVLAELGWMAMGVVDTVMVGPVGAEAIGAVGVGRAAFFVVAVFGMGLLLGLDTLVSRSHGAGDADDCRHSLVQGVYVSVAAAVPGTALLAVVTARLEPWGLAPEVVGPAQGYLRALSWSLLPLLLFNAFRRYLQAVGRPRPVMVALVSANLINVAANWVLIYGRLGAPALGAAGAGWATGISNVYLTAFLLLAVVLHAREEPRGGLRRGLAPDLERLRRLLALGLPAAGQLVVEVAAFAAATAFAGRLDPASLAAHHLALTCASVTFMVPLGISSATAVRVGHALGAGRPRGAGRAGWSGIALGAAFMAVAALAFFVLPRPILRSFTADSHVLGIGVSLLGVAALFQLFDGLQVVATGALRGGGDTQTPLACNLVGHWVLGLPTGYYLCFVAGWGVVGLWAGWVVGLGSVGIALVVAWSRVATRYRGS